MQLEIQKRQINRGCCCNPDYYYSENSHSNKLGNPEEMNRLGEMHELPRLNQEDKNPELPNNRQ